MAQMVEADWAVAGELAREARAEKAVSNRHNVVTLGQS